MYPSIKKVVALDNHLLAVDFDNGESGILDMKPFLNFGIFRRLMEQNAFNQVRIAFDTIEWDSGIDIDPEFVYEKCQRQKTS